MAAEAVFDYRYSNIHPPIEIQPEPSVSNLDQSPPTAPATERAWPEPVWANDLSKTTELDRLAAIDLKDIFDITDIDDAEAESIFWSTQPDVGPLEIIFDYFRNNRAVIKENIRNDFKQALAEFDYYQGRLPDGCSPRRRLLIGRALVMAAALTTGVLIGSSLQTDSDSSNDREIPSESERDTRSPG